MSPLATLSAIKTVLVVDDDRVLARLVSSFLQQERIATLCAYDLPEAHLMISTRRVDAVILDLQMPSGNGDELVRRLKESKRTSPIAVLVLTSSAHAEDARRLLDLGADAFLQKPPDLPSLLKTLRRLLRATGTLSRAEATTAAV